MPQSGWKDEEDRRLRSGFLVLSFLPTASTCILTAGLAAYFLGNYPGAPVFPHLPGVSEPDDPSQTDPDPRNPLLPPLGPESFPT